MKTLLLVLISITIALSSYGQVEQVEIGVDGLTCSQCTRSTELSLRKLSFVHDVKMDLSHTNGIIKFKKDAAVSFEEIAQAVVNAGFSMRYLEATINFESKRIKKGDCIILDDQILSFVNEKEIGNSTKIKFLSKDFLPKSEAKKWSAPESTPCDDTQMPIYQVML